MIDGLHSIDQSSQRFAGVSFGFARHSTKVERAETVSFFVP